MEDHRYDPKQRHARVHKDAEGAWQIATCYDLLPLNAFITYEYAGDYFLPVVWETLYTSDEEREEVAYKVSEAFLHPVIVTPTYFAGDGGEVYLLQADGTERLICLTPHLGDGEEIAHALNQTFPGGDTEAWHAARRQEAYARMGMVQQALGIDTATE